MSFRRRAKAQQARVAVAWGLGSVEAPHLRQLAQQLSAGARL